MRRGCAGGPLDHAVIDLGDVMVAKSRVRVCVAAKAAKVGPNKITVVYPSTPRERETRPVHIYELCNMQHYHYVGVE